MIPRSDRLKAEQAEEATLKKRYNAAQKARIDAMVSTYPEAGAFLTFLRRIQIGDASRLLTAVTALDWLRNSSEETRWTMLKAISRRAIAIREAAGMTSFDDPIDRGQPSFIEKVKKEMGL